MAYSHHTSKTLGAVLIALISFGPYVAGATQQPQQGYETKVEIAPSGKTLLRGIVESVSDSLIRVKSWGGLWLVNIRGDAERIGMTNGASIGMVPGDYVGIQGSIVPEEERTIEATVVRDWTVPATKLSSIGSGQPATPTTIATGDPIPTDYLLVKFHKEIGGERRAEVLARHGLNKVSELKQVGIQRVKVKTTGEAQKAVTMLAKERGIIEFAEIDMRVAPTLALNDPLIPNEWHIAKMQVPVAWDTASGAGITIGIADGGVDCTHPDLATSCVPGWNTVSNNASTTDVSGHGTKVAGTAAAIGNNATQVAGVAYQAKIMPLRITNDPGGWAYFSDIAEAIIWGADHGARVVNASYQTADSASVKSAADYMMSKGGLYTTSAGNDGVDKPITNYDSIVSAGATDSNDAKTSWSNWGTGVDVVAPGASILTTTNGGGTGYVSGTSFSAPNTAGVIALILSVNPRLTPSQVRQILFESVDDLGVQGYDTTYGWGRINATKAVASAVTVPVDTTAPSVPQDLATTSITTTAVNLSWKASTDNVGVTGYKVFRNGTEIATVAGTSYSDTKIATENTYTYTVRAFDVAQNMSADSNIVTVVTPKALLTVTTSVTTTGIGATVKWTTNLPSTGIVTYGTSQNALTSRVEDTVAQTSHTVSITNLAKRTTYYYRVTAYSADGQVVESSILSFKTKNR